MPASQPVPGPSAKTSVPVRGDFLALIEQGLGQGADQGDLELPVVHASQVLPFPVPGFFLPPVTVAAPEATPEPLPQIPLPISPETPKVELLADPSVPSGQCAFQLEMTAPEAPSEAPHPDLPQPVPHLPRSSAAPSRKPLVPVLATSPKREQKPQLPGDRPAVELAAPVTALSTQAPVSTDASPVETESMPAVKGAQSVDAVENLPRPSASTHHIALRVKSDDDRSVDVRLTSRAGQIHVSVHSPDETLVRSMRTELGALTGKLTQAGYGVQSVSLAGSDSSSFNERREGSPEQQDAPPQRQHEPQQDSRQQQQGERRRPLPFLFDLELT